MHPKLSNLIKLSSQTENYVKIVGYKTHQKIESYQKDVMNLRTIIYYPYTIGMQTLFVNITKSEKVMRLNEIHLYVKQKLKVHT